ncbi:protein-disulfide reductase DsbD [Iodobacter sp.]|uniref:protein-disulfide reductase DsbD n=1 Tax=Iodobacter sp. TaxID=1915058 RepID=UPI0025EFC57C|nr:protein-disulfide reductase DsbD [Iodobacter sp.]
MLRSLWIGLLLALLWLPFAQAEDNFLPPEQAFKLVVSKEQSGQIKLHWDIAQGYYLYRKNIKVESLPAGLIEKTELPAGIAKTDEFFGETEVYFNQVDVLLKAPHAKVLAISWQGCAEAGLCYQPQTRQIKLDQLDALDRPASPLNRSDSQLPVLKAGPVAELGEDQQIAQRLSQAHLGWMLLMFLGLGLLMTFTPCVLPMIPILSSLIAGSGATPRRGFILSLAFVLPMALTYAALGAAAAMAGANLQAFLQNPWALGVFGMIFVLLALAMFGAYELQLPAVVRDRLSLANQKSQGGTIAGAATMGFLSALLVGPCMTAPLAGALLYISNTGDVLKGSLALLSMGLGMGLPLLLVGTLGARFLPRPGIWMNRVKMVFGFVLLGMAILFMARIMPPALALALWGALLLAMAFCLWALLLPSQAWAIRSLAAVMALWGAAMVLGAAAGNHNPYQPLVFMQATAAHSQESPFLERFITVNSTGELAAQIQSASEKGQWALVDYYADWCVACKEIERDVLGDARVQQALAGMKLIRPDVTASGEQSQALLSAYQVLGPPTLLLIGPDGKERRAQRIVGKLSADAFLARLAQAKL